MAEFDEKSLKAHIKNGDLMPVYLFNGDEDYLRKLYCDMLIEKAVNKDFFDFNFQEFDVKNLDLRDVFEASEMLPMMSDRRCVLVRNAKLESMNDEDFSLLKTYLENPCESTVLIFYQSDKEFPLTKAKKAADIIRKTGAICTLKKRSGNDLIKPLMKSAEKQGCQLSQQAANYLVSVVGDDFNVLINELGKVCHYAGGGEITKSHIDEVAVKTDDAKIYDLTKFMLMKKFDKAFEILSVLLRQKVEPEYILGAITGSYVDMYRAKVSLACGMRADELADAYSYGKMAFRLTNGAKVSSGIDINTVRRCLDELHKADTKLKNSRDNPNIILEQLIVRLFLVSGGERL